jgi:DNA-binding transcriptional ArsR family regulator
MITGDTDLSAIGALLSEPARARILLALADGRALPASMLASEAGVAASTASEHLRRLTGGGLITVTTHGRFRYYRLAGPAVGDLIEAMARLAPAQPVTSLREGTKANAIRKARRCYDHAGGRLGVALTDAFLRLGYLAGHDGSIDLGRMPGGRPAGGVLDPVAYTLTDAGAGAFRELGTEPPGNRAVRCCVDWTEQRHHMAGAAGRGLLRQLEQHGWVKPSRYHRALTLTEEGRAQLISRFGIIQEELDPPRVA